ncbi:Thiamine kinase [Providencia sneebia DSM 19967]|uniref:Thiamine kinase n=1 Tax=Providencia sneebia DSM 19967 TaxID=1141660 RepID=K8W960_9GAMM|nr:Thiamine kinase [Providencia sneebia DSM 19967]
MILSSNYNKSAQLIDYQSLFYLTQDKCASLLSLLGRTFSEVSPHQWEITPLNGLSGGTYHLKSSFLHVIARISSKAQTSLFVDRRKEMRVLQQLRHFGHAPKALARNAHWLLLSWCKGEHPSEERFYTSQFQSSLADVVAKLHTQPLLSYSLPLRNEIIHYGRLIDKKRYSPQWHKLHGFFLAAKMPNILKLAPAHMDIHRGNILIDEKSQLILLDWEYAANTDIALSLETYFQANQLNKMQRQFFLSDYCDKHNAYSNRQKLAHHCNLWEPWVKYMMLMWYEVQWNQSKKDVFLLHSKPLRQYFCLPI